MPSIHGQETSRAIWPVTAATSPSRPTRLERGSGQTPLLVRIVRIGAVLDEVCDATDDGNYLTRFETLMFRSVAVVNDAAYLVDASHLWVVSLSNPSQPKRLALVGLPCTAYARTKTGTASATVTETDSATATVAVTAPEPVPTPATDAVAVVGAVNGQLSIAECPKKCSTRD